LSNIYFQTLPFTPRIGNVARWIKEETAMKKTLAYLHSQVQNLQSSLPTLDRHQLEADILALLKDIESLQGGTDVDTLNADAYQLTEEEQRFLAEQDAAFSRAKEAEDNQA
jgi:hypothetical protein|tara:strand:+ start:1865 stop:2197 length:333 start_codon:yes stop_codon:yes gene_type:complete